MFRLSPNFLLKKNKKYIKICWLIAEILIYYLLYFNIFKNCEISRSQMIYAANFLKRGGDISSYIAKLRKMNYLGNHLLVELYNCNTSLINKVVKIEELLLEAVKISGATALNSTFHKFSPHGVSGVVVISESHFSIHTWPEYGYCALDIFTCGTEIKEVSINWTIE